MEAEALPGSHQRLRWVAEVFLHYSIMRSMQQNIIIKKPRNLLSNVKPEFKKKFFVIVDALDASDQLSTNKHSVRGGIFPKEIESLNLSSKIEG